MRPVYPGSTARHGACPPRRPVKQRAKAHKAPHPSRETPLPHLRYASTYFRFGSSKATEWFEVAYKSQICPLADRPKHLCTREHRPLTMEGFVATHALLATAPQHGATAALFTLIAEPAGYTRVTTRT